MELKNIPFGSAEAFNVLIEIPKGSKIKYEYDEELEAMKLDFVFSGKLEFISNYGLIPGTRGGDNDHLDCHVLGENPIAAETIVLARAIGLIETLDRGEEDNKIIAVPLSDPVFAKIQTLEDLPRDLSDDFREFFKEIGIQKNKVIEVLGFYGKDRAIQEIKKCMIK